MKKTSAILSPMVILMASTSLAQDSCILRPSCADMGYTKTEAECTGKDSIKCPFDLTALFCPEGGSSSSEPETLTCAFGFVAKNGECVEIDNAIAFVINVTESNGSIELSTGSSSGYIIDWGDGTIDNSLSTSRPTHVYADAGEYQIVITGNVLRFYVSKFTNSHTTKILNLDLDSVKSYGYTETSYHNDRTYYYSPFKDCSNVSGEIPDELPPNLEKAYALFDGCSGLTGQIPDLPDSLTEATEMFYGCTGLTGNIPTLPNSLEDGTSMFYNCSGLTGNIPNLPTSLVSATGMFNGCSGLTGNIPTLPNSLEDGTSMFYNCSGLTGNIPNLPTSLVSASSMFNGCSEVNGSVSSFPSDLQKADYMFKNTKLSGVVPNLPTGLSSAKEMFYGTNITKIPSNLGSLTALKDGSYMFYECESMKGPITAFPPQLENGDYMFFRCYNLDGPIPNLPTTLKSAEYMFFNDYSLTSLPSNLGSLTNLTEMSDMFRGCGRSFSGQITMLPPNVKYAARAFTNLSNITGFPSNFGSLTQLSSANEMFSGCTNISGEAPEYTPFKNNHLYYTDIFKGTKITNNTSDPWPDSAW